MKTVAQNRRARHDYEITDTVEAGIMLSGQEVKSCRQGNVNLAGAYVLFLRGKPFLRGAKIAPYAFASALEEYRPDRERELLLKKTETLKLESAVQEKGVTVVPLEVRAGKFIKVLLGIGKGRTKGDKRQKIKERDVEKKLRRGDEY